MQKSAESVKEGEKRLQNCANEMMSCKNGEDGQDGCGEGSYV